MVDGDPALLEATSELVEILGHSAATTASPEIALRWLAEQPLGVLFADLAMPGMAGTELAERAVELRRALQAVFAIGNEVPYVRALPFRCRTLRKPYTLEEVGSSGP